MVNNWQIKRMRIKRIITLALILSLLTLEGCSKKYTISVNSDQPECSVSGGGTYTKGTIIAIKANPAPGYQFGYWDSYSGDYMGDENPHYITVEHSDVYTAIFLRDNGGGGGNSTISAPTGVSASLYQESGQTYIYVTWNIVSNAAQYNIYYSTTSSGSYTNIGNVTTNYCYISNPNTDNYIKISAVDANGNESSLSSYAYCQYGGSGGGGGNAPDAPTGVTATNIGSSSSPNVKIQWSSVSNATSYKVYRSASASGTYSQLGSSTSNTYAYDNNPMSGYNYYKVKAINSVGESPYSSYAYFNNNGGGGGGSTTYSPCPPTINVSGSTTQTVSWSISTSSGCGTPTSYEVYKYDPCTGTWDLKTTTTSRSYTSPAANVHPGINRYAVKAINSAGSAQNYGYSNEVSLSYPSSFSAQKQGSDNIRFSWSRVTKATGYQIFMSSTANGTYVLLDQVDDGETTTKTVYYPGSSGTTYYFKMKAVYSCGTSPIYSNFTTYRSVTF